MSPVDRNLSTPSLMDTTPPPIIAEMQAMKEQMEVMMNALKGRVSSDLDDLVNRTGLAIHYTSQLLSPATEVSNAAA